MKEVIDKAEGMERQENQQEEKVGMVEWHQSHLGATDEMEV